MPRAVVVQKQKDLFKKGEVIFKEGSEGSVMYIIKTGRVEVVKQTGDEEVILATLEPKAFFGEMALFGDPHRSATVRAAMDTEMIVITKPMLESQFEKVPDWFVSILKSLVERLRKTNKRIKSRFRISLEFSILRILFLLVRKRGEASPEGYTLPLKSTITEISRFLGVTETEVYDKFKNFKFVNLIKYYEPDNKLFIPDMDRLEYFNAWLRSHGNESTRVMGLERTTSDDELKRHFEKIHKLLFRRKMVSEPL